MSSNYPPGMSAAPSSLSAARFVCPAHGKNYGYSWHELGGFFVENNLPRGCDEFEHDDSQACPEDCYYLDHAQWEEDVEAERCTQITLQARNPHDNEIEHTIVCGSWTEYVVDVERDDSDEEFGIVVVTTTWLCGHGHEFETEELR